MMTSTLVVMNHPGAVSDRPSGGTARRTGGVFSGYLVEQRRNAAGLVASLSLAALLVAVAMPLPWHHMRLLNGGYTIVRGMETDSWLILVALIGLAFVSRFQRWPPRFYAKWLLTITAVLTAFGMFVDYIDWQNRAAQQAGTLTGPNTGTYFGPGFYVALAATAFLLVAAVIAWRID